MLCCQVFIDVTGVPDLNVTTATSSGLTVGAAVSLQALIDLCVAQDPMSPSYTNDPTTETVTTATSSYSALARHLLLVANQQVCRCLCSVFCDVMNANYNMTYGGCT